jgi:predicted transcriptional regulator
MMMSDFNPFVNSGYAANSSASRAIGAHSVVPHCAAGVRHFCIRLDNPTCYSAGMSMIRRTIEIDIATDARLSEMADERGQDVAAVLAEAVALLDSVVDIAGPDIAEDRRRLDEFNRTRLAIPLDDVKAWVASWGLVDEIPRPQPRKIG